MVTTTLGNERSRSSTTELNLWIMFVKYITCNLQALCRKEWDPQSNCHLLVPEFKFLRPLKIMPLQLQLGPPSQTGEQMQRPHSLHSLKTSESIASNLRIRGICLREKILEIIVFAFLNLCIHLGLSSSICSDLGCTHSQGHIT